MAGHLSIDSMYIKTNFCNYFTMPVKPAKNLALFPHVQTKKLETKPEKLIVKKAEEILNQNINEGNGKELIITQGRVEQWCADTVNYIYEQTFGKNPFGLNKNGTYKSSVKELKNWGIKNKRFKSANNEEKINEQLKTMKPGDVIIWKSLYTVKVEGGKTIKRHAGHTGIVKEISADGIVSIVEGNSNIAKRNEKGEYLLVHNEKEGTNGSQAIGDFQEVNPFDGIIVKKYTANDLKNSGYSGYIDMQSFNLK